MPAGWPNNSKLAGWVHKLRASYKKGALSDQRIERLEALGFEWDALDATWEELFATLQEYKTAHDDCNVPQRWQENPQLANWVGVQRRSYKKGQLSDKHTERLEALGFLWDVLDAVWEEMFAALRDYKKAHGNCNVLRGSLDNPQLGNWIHNQRASYKQGKLSKERIERLESLGFMWDKYEAAWGEMFAALREYKTAHGNCNVLRGSLDNPQLGNWIHNQRASYKQGKLSKERIERLETLGFVWDKFEAVWEEMFAALQAYKAAHGHCNVPAKWPDNPQLGSWVSTQRYSYKNDQISKERIVRLESLGFVWDRR